MGRSRIEIEMVSGHGCDRDANAGDALKAPCDSAGCMECKVRKAISEYVASQGEGAFTSDGCGAKITHWPNQRSENKPSGEIVDDLVTGRRRHGSFK